MFYTKKLELYKITDGGLDESGIWVDGEEKLLGSYYSDVQPYNNELAYKHYGYKGDVSYKIFTPMIDDVELGYKIKYNNKLYTIVICLKWDDYCILVVSDKDD